MRVSTLLTHGLFQATAILASPHDARNNKVILSKRPNHAIEPHYPGTGLPASPERTKTCVVQASGNGTDDSASILKAINDCNNGGHVVFPKDQNFTIGTALNLTHLQSVDLGEDLTCITYLGPLLTVETRHPRHDSVHK
jgi:galacturan 1,4-alpha-galacturonidase